jgi:DNA-binding transcriptional LysR family regulator
MQIPPLSLMASFLAFSGASNMVEAAKKLGISQPSLTSHLKSFASYFSEELFASEGRRKVLTPFGRKLAEKLGTRLEGLSADLKAVSDEFSSPEQITVRIGGRAEIVGQLAKEIRFAGSLLFFNVDGAEAIAGLLERKFDLAVSGRQLNDSHMHRRKLFSDGFALLAPKKYFADGANLSKGLLRELCEQPYLSYTPVDERLKRVFEHFAIQERPRVSKALANWDKLVEMVENQQGWTIVPSRFVSAGARLSHAVIPSSILPLADFFLLYRRESIAMPWFQKLVQQLVAQARS